MVADDLFEIKYLFLKLGFSYCDRAGETQSTMITLISTSALLLATSLGLTALSGAAVYTYSMSSDNDMTFYTGNSTGTVLTEHFNQTAVWSTVISGSLTSFDDYIYVVGMNFGGPGSFAGFINGVDVSTLPWETTINVSGAITGYTGSSTL